MNHAALLPIVYIIFLHGMNGQYVFFYLHNVCKNGRLHAQSSDGKFAK
jgi:hypothetical protein